MLFDSILLNTWQLHIVHMLLLQSQTTWLDILYKKKLGKPHLSQLLKWKEATEEQPDMKRSF